MMGHLLARFGLRPRTLDPRAAYDLWAPAYPPWAHNALMRAEQRALAPMLASLRASDALDVGTGSGRYLPLLAKAGARRVVGLDMCQAMILAHRDAFPRVCGDAVQLPFASGSFDVVLAALMVGDIADLDSWAVEMQRVLRPGGHLLYSDFHPSWTHAGWERTLQTTDGRTYVVPHYAHALADHRDALTLAGLDLVDVRETGLEAADGDEVEVFQRRWGPVPVVLILHAVKPA